MDHLRYAPLSLCGILLLAAIGLWRLYRRRPDAKLWLTAAFVSLWLVCWPPFAALAAGTLEWQTPRSGPPPYNAQAIVVLSGGLIAADPPEPPAVANQATYVRCLHAAWLYQHGAPLPVVVTGGDTSQGLNLAEAMAALLRRNGVPAADIWKERGAESTYENARFVARLLAPRGIRRILLVTEAYHMPRSVRVFRRAGFDVVPSPCFFQSSRFGQRWSDWVLPTPNAILTCEDAIHEWIGLLVYRLRGRI